MNDRPRASREPGLDRQREPRGRAGGDRGVDRVGAADPGRVVIAGSDRTVSAMRVAGGQAFELRPVDVIEEPDVVGSWEELDTFYARQGEIWQRLQAPSVELLVDGVWREVPVEGR